MERELMTIGELAKWVGVTVRTLQYYDKEGILKPSALSKGGHRLYAARDVVKLHQILSFKYLGFSLEEIKNHILPLDTPEQMVSILIQQQKAIEEQIENLQEAAQSIEAFRNEVENIKSVDFEKYAEIIELLKMGNEAYWVWKCFDDTLSHHIKERFGRDPALGEKTYHTYLNLLDEAVSLVQEGEAPESERSKRLAEKWWKMIMDFTGGDMTLIPKLESFNRDKTGWNQELAQKQHEIDAFMNKMLNCYFKEQGMGIPEKDVES